MRKMIVMTSYKNSKEEFSDSDQTFKHEVIFVEGVRK
jgi:hypothetical protein